MGLKNLLTRENKKWWATSRWWIQLLVWGLITNGILFLLMFLVPFIIANFEGVNPAALNELPNGTVIFFSMAGIAMPIGVVILLQGSIISEREMGTAEWILSKPVSRTAFILSKLIANAFGILIIYVILQSLIAFSLITLKDGATPPLTAFLTGSGILAI